MPILDVNGRAMVAIWIADFRDSNVGPHHELQFSLLGTRASSDSKPGIVMADDPYAIFNAFTGVPGIRMVCHGLWNSTKRVVIYNAEHLKLDAHVSQSEISVSDGRWKFSVSDTETGAQLVEGELSIPASQAAWPMWGVVKQVGFWGTLRSMLSPFVQVPVLNTRSKYSEHGGLVAQTATAPQKQLIREFEEGDRFVIKHSGYSGLDFKPTVVQMMEGVRFVYLRPEADVAA